MKRFIVLLMTLAIVLSMVACATPTPAPTAAPAQSAAATAAPAATPVPAQKVSITFADTWVDQAVNGVIPYQVGFIKAWQDANPNVTLTVNSSSSSDYQNTVFNTMVAADNLPQVFEVNSSAYRSVVTNNKLMDLTSLCNADTKWFNSFLPGIFGEGTFDGKIYCVPYQFITNECIFYNKDILSSVGATSVPSDWEGFLALCQKLKDGGYIPVSFGDKDQWPLCSNIMEVMSEYMCGKQWVDDIGAYNGKASYDTPDFVAVLNLMKDFYDKGYFNSDMLSVGNFGPEVYAYLNNKKAAMYLGGSYCLGGLYTGLSDDLKKSFSVAPIPRPAASKPDFAAGLYTGGSGWAYALNVKDTQAETDASMSLIKYLTGTDISKAAVENGYIPVLKMSEVTGWDTSKVSMLQQAMNTSISQAPQIRLMNQEQSGPTMNQIIYTDLQNLCSAVMTPEQVAKDIEATYQQACAATSSGK